MTPGDSRPEVISLHPLFDSGAGQRRKGRIDRQRRANEAGAMPGLRIRREMLCIDVSGRHVKDDPQFQALFEEMKDPTLTGVIAPEQSRIFRPEEYADYAILDHFGRNKKLIFTPSARIDPTTSEGRMTLVMGGLMSGEELHKIRDRCNGGKMTKRLEGKHPGGNQLLPKTVKFVRVRNAEGIKTGETYWELVPIEVARMKLAFQLLFEGDSYELIAEKIGGGWTGSGLHRAMMNPIHIGIRRYQWEAKGDEYMPKASAKNPKPKKRRRLVKRAAPLDIPTREDLESGKAKPIVEPILTLAEWDRAQEIIVSRMTRWRKSKLKNDGRARHLATGIACCSCSDPLYPRYGSRTPDNDFYLCKTRFRGGKGCGAQLIRRDEMDAAIEQTVSMLADADFLLCALQSALDLQNDAPDPARIQREQMLAKLEAGRKEMLAMVRGGDMTRDEFRREMAQLENEKRALEAIAPAAAPQFDPKEVLDLINRAFSEFAFLTFTEKRALLRGAVKEIIVDSRARSITSLTISGGYMGTGANSVPHLRLRYWRQDRAPGIERRPQRSRGFSSVRAVHSENAARSSRSRRRIAPPWSFPSPGSCRRIPA